MSRIILFFTCLALIVGFPAFAKAPLKKKPVMVKKLVFKMKKEKKYAQKKIEIMEARFTGDLVLEVASFVPKKQYKRNASLKKVVEPKSEKVGKRRWRKLNKHELLIAEK